MAGWNVLVVDDEPPIRAELSFLLGRDARVGTVIEAQNGVEAIERILAHKPDVLFLDIQMPGMNGMRIAETLSSLKNPPLLVFVTAYNQFAADAFDLNAVDYVLKPVEEARLARTLDKVALMMASRSRSARDDQPRRIQVERAGERMFIPVGDISYIEARADYSYVHTAAGSYLVGESISSLERQLESEGFVRVHRSYLVNVDDIHDVVMTHSGLLELHMDRVDAAVPVARRKTAQVKGRLGIA